MSKEREGWLLYDKLHAVLGGVIVDLWFSWKMALVATAPTVGIVFVQLALTAYLKRRTHNDNKAAMEAAKVSRSLARPPCRRRTTGAEASRPPGAIAPNERASDSPAVFRSSRRL